MDYTVQALTTIATKLPAGETTALDGRVARSMYVIIAKMYDVDDPRARRRVLLGVIVLATLPCYCLGVIALAFAPQPGGGEETAIATSTTTPWSTLTPTPSGTPTSTLSATPSPSLTPSLSPTPYVPPTLTSTGTATASETPTSTEIPTETPSETLTITPLSTAAEAHLPGGTTLP